MKSFKLGIKLIVNFGKYIKVILRYFSVGRNCFFYSGRYEIWDSIVIYYIEVSLVFDWVGLDFECNVEFLEG